MDNYSNGQSKKAQQAISKEVPKSHELTRGLLYIEDNRTDMNWQNELRKVINACTHIIDHPTIQRSPINFIPPKQNGTCPIQGIFKYCILGSHGYVINTETEKIYFLESEIPEDALVVYACDTERICFNPKIPIGGDNLRREPIVPVDSEVQDEELTDNMDEELTETFLVDTARQSLSGGDESIVVNYSKVVTDLTVRVDLIPETPETPEIPETPETPETPQFAVYMPIQLKVNAISMGDKDRPSTRFDNQESHTCAWTLVREAFLNMEGQSLLDLLEQLKGFYQMISSSETTEEGSVLLAMAQEGFLILTLQNAKLPLDIWNRIISNLIVNLLQCYQQSSASTYKKGRPIGHGEANAMAFLREINFRIENEIADETMDYCVPSIPIRARQLLDVAFSKSLGPAGYAHAIFHWITMLQNAFPSLMLVFYDEITSPVLGKLVAKSFLTMLGCSTSDQVTVGEMLTHFCIHPGQLEAVEHKEKEEMPVEELALNQLNSQFTANVILTPFRPLSVYTPSELQVSGLRISDRDRPKTRFITRQGSHTIPWTLARATILSFKNKGFDILLSYIESELTRLAPFVENDDGKAALARAFLLFESLRTGQPLCFCMALASQLIQYYFVAYQVAKTSSYVSPQEAGQPLGHGEAHNMSCLERNEYALENGDNFLDDPAFIVQAACRLIDAQQTEDFPPNLIEEVWNDLLNKLTIAFPSIMYRLGDAIQKRGNSFLPLPEPTTERSVMNELFSMRQQLVLCQSVDWNLFMPKVTFLLEQQMEHSSPGVEGYLFTYYHWREMIYTLLPEFEGKEGEALLNVHLQQPLPSWALEELGRDEDNPISIGEALNNLQNFLGDFSFTRIHDFAIENDYVLPNADLFLQNQVSTYSNKMGICFVLERSEPSNSPLCRIDKLTIVSLKINNDGWVQAKYEGCEGQKNQALPWGIMREWVLHFVGGPLIELYKELEVEFDSLNKKAQNQVGANAITTARNLLQAALKETSTYQIFINTCELIRNFYIATQLDQCSIYTIPDELLVGEIMHSKEKELQLMRIAEKNQESGELIPFPLNFIAETIQQIVEKVPEDNRKSLSDNIISKLKLTFPLTMRTAGFIQ